MNKKEAARFLEEVIGQLFNHGWAEDYQCHMEYNDTSDLMESIASGEDGKYINALISNTDWDEEACFKYDDGGLSSFAIEVTKLMRKHKLLTDDKLPLKETKIRKSINYSYNCPHCNSHRGTDDFDGVTECPACENPIKITGEK